MRGFLFLLCALLAFTAAAQQIASNSAPRRISLEAKWVEIPASALSTLSLGPGTTNEGGTNWVLSSKQTAHLLQTVQAMTNATLCTGPRLVGWTRQDAHLAVQEDVVVVTGIKPAATVPPGISAEKTDEVYETQSLPVGQWIDVLPEFSPETGHFHLTLVAQRTEMQGYDHSDRNVTALAWVNNKRLELKVPMPRYVTTRCFNVADVPDGSTLVFGGFKPVPGGPFGGPRASSATKVFLALVTPTVPGTVENVSNAGSSAK